VDLPPLTLVFRFGGFLLPSAMRFDTDFLAPSSAVGVAAEVILAETRETGRDESDFINHSCLPNMGMQDAISLVTIRPVRAGDELTADYAYWEISRDYNMKELCRCGAAQCRAQVTGNDWSTASPGQPLWDWASPFIKARMRAAHKIQP